MNRLLLNLLILCLISSTPTLAVFAILWIRYDFDYAWGTFEAIVEDAIG